MRALVFPCLALAAFATAGCLEGEPGQGAQDPYPALCNGDGPAMWAALEKRVAGNPGLETDPRQPWSTVVALRGDPSFGLLVEDGNGTAAWFANGTEARLGVLTQQPPAAYVDVTVSAEGVDCVRFAAPDWAFQDPREGALAEVGKGVLVYTAGFWENGTLFYTNMPEVHDIDGYGSGDDLWPRAGWYTWEGDDPLPVYVYENDPSEVPPHWGAAGQLPVDGEAGSRLPGRYFPTIPGFNGALKGLSTSTMTVVHVAPEDAYTREGNEDHPLYGDALVFLIRAVAVAEQPCPVSAWASDGVVPSGPCFRR